MIGPFRPKRGRVHSVACTTYGVLNHTDAADLDYCYGVVICTAAFVAKTFPLSIHHDTVLLDLGISCTIMAVTSSCATEFGTKSSRQGTGFGILERVFTISRDRKH